MTFSNYFEGIFSAFLTKAKEEKKTSPPFITDVFEFKSSLGKDHIIDMMMAFRGDKNITWENEDEIANTAMPLLPRKDELKRWDTFLDMNIEELYQEFLRCANAEEIKK